MLLDGVDYYQVVFTLPSELSRLALGNRQSLSDLLFASAWKSLSKTIRSEQGYDPAAIMVLHTWNQKLQAHWHVHAIVPGAGPGIRGAGWQTSTAPPASGLSDDHYLVDAINLRTAFRKIATSHLQRLRKRGELKLDVDPDFGDLRTDDNWDALIEHLQSVDWVSFIQPPPAGSSGPNDLVRYLTRYLTGGPISDSRIVAADAGEVTFMAREGKVQGGQSVQVPVTLSTEEFVRRWCLHIQPDQLTKTRYFGGWSNNQLTAYQESCVSMMNAAEVPLSPEATEFPPPEPESGQWESESSTVRSSTARGCWQCGEEGLRLTARHPRSSWSELLGQGSVHVPAWYRESLEFDDERFWDGCYGAGFNAWYLEHVVESAYQSAAQPSVPQMMLAGLEPSRSNALE